MIKKILVVGGTGMLGLPVVEALLQASFEVTVMSTDVDNAQIKLPDSVPIIKGDVRDIDSLRKGFDGFEAVYLNLNSKLIPELYESIEIGGTANAAMAARENDVKRIAIISGASSKGVEKGIIYLDARVKAERNLIESGVPYTIFRPSWFFESLPHFIQDGRAIILGKQPLKLGWLAATDYAAQVVKAFQTDEAANKCFYNLGPSKLTMMEALEKYCEELQPDLKPQSFSFMQAKMFSKMPGMEKLKIVIPFFEYFEKNDEDVDPTEANEILGANKTNLEQWIKTKY